MMPVKVAIAFLLIIVGLGLMWIGTFFAWLNAQTARAAKCVLAP